VAGNEHRNNRTRGQVVPHADPRAYTDHLNALVSPQGWTRTYEMVTMNNITRKRNAEIVTGKILVTCKVTIDGLGTHSGTGEEWADEDNAMTSAEAQAFKRACSVLDSGATSTTSTRRGSISTIRVDRRRHRHSCLG
jgi:hypothetical protein